ncbi:tyrosine phosphatase family-domain-containing protein [Xylaria sp. FL1777]|nr:tyrosine phosphatase family-domain-containing protein [Xylaria sp. FL1777]
MGDCNTAFNQLQVADAPCEGKLKPGMSGPYYKKASQSTEVASRRNSLAKNVSQESQESQTCTGRIVLGRPMPTAHQPPVNFSMVCEGLYRSGYPQTQDYPFMQGLNLKTIVTLVNKELPDGYQEFIRNNQITHKIFDMAGTKKEDISIELMCSIYAVVSNRENYPLLIHCNHGRHRTGCVVGVLRKSSQWNMKRIIDEYTTFAEPKVREVDIKYLAEFELAHLLHQSRAIVSSRIVGRFYRFAAVTVLLLFAMSPLGKFRNQESRFGSS